MIDLPLFHFTISLSPFLKSFAPFRFPFLVSVWSEWIGGVFKMIWSDTTELGDEMVNLEGWYGEHCWNLLFLRFAP